MPENLSHRFNKTAQKFSNKIAIRWKEGSLTYGELKRRIELGTVPEGDCPQFYPIRFFATLSDKDPACIFSTSGTTDLPKGIALSHRNLLANCDSLAKLGLITENDSVVSILPLHHAYALTVTMLLPLLSGAEIVYPASIRGEDILAAMQEFNPTVFVAVPQIYSQFHKKITERLAKIPFPFRPLAYPGVRRKFGKRIRLLVSGGAKLDEKVEKDFFKFGFKLIEGYGLTETSPVLTINPVKKPKIGSVGLPIPDVEIKIKEGEVLARGPNVMEGCYKDGWFHTGDLGYIDEDGYLFLTGRSKDIIVLSSGLNIYPDEIEKAYLTQVPAKEMCVFEAGGLRAVIVPDLDFFKKYGEVNLQSVIKERIDNVSKTLPPSKRLMGFSISLEPLPRTLLGKVKRFEVKEKYGKIGAVPAGEKKGTVPYGDSPLFLKIIDCLRKQTGVKGPITPESSLELDLGIDSLGRLELASALEQALGVKIADEVVGRSFIVRDLFNGLEEKGDSPLRGQSPFSSWRDRLEAPPAAENLAKIDLKPGFGAWLWGFTFTCLVKAFFKLFYSFKVEGQENVPKKGPFMLYANHTSYFDGFLVAAAMPKFPRLDLFFVGFKPYFDVPATRNLVRIGRVIPLDFSAHLLEALRSCYYVLMHKKGLCLFPEGLRTLEGKVGKFKTGFGILAKESGAQLVPIYIEGAFEAWPRTARFPRRHPITVKIGKPITPQGTYEDICASARSVLQALAL